MSTRVESGIVPASDENQPTTAPEGGHQTAVRSAIVGGSVDTRRVSNEGDTPVQGVADKTATLAVPLEPTVDTAAVARRSLSSDVATVGNGTPNTVPGPAYTHDTTRPPTGALTEGEDQRKEALEALWALLREVGYESW